MPSWQNTGYIYETNKHMLMLSASWQPLQSRDGLKKNCILSLTVTFPEAYDMCKDVAVRNFTTGFMFINFDRLVMNG